MVENEDLVFTLETIMDKFGEEKALYAIGLCQNWAAAFWRCINASEVDDEADDPGALALVGCLRAISTILESVSRIPHLFIEIDPTLMPIMKRMLTDGQGNYICKGTLYFLTCKEPDYQQSLWNVISYIMSNSNMEDIGIVPAPKLIEAVFQNCKGQVDHWVEPYLRITIDRLHRAKKPDLRYLLIQVIANAFYHNACLTLGALHKLGVAAKIFDLWFQMLQQTCNCGGHIKKVCCLGLTSILALPTDQLSGEDLERVFKTTIELLALYQNQAAATKEDDTNKDDEMDGSNVDEDDEVDESDKEIGDDDDETDEEKVFHLDDEYSDDEELQSPIDEAMDLHYRALSTSIAEHADERKLAIAKEKLKMANHQ